MISRGRGANLSTREPINRSNASGTSTVTERSIDHDVSSLTNAPVSTSDENRSSKNRGFPSIFVRKAPITSLPASSPTIERASSSSASSLRGASSTLRNGQRELASKAVSSAETPGSGSGRLVASSNRGVSCASAASSSVSRSDVGSAQCKSSSTRTVGPFAASLVITARTEAKVARWNPSGLNPARRTPSARVRNPIMWARKAVCSTSPANTAFMARSSAGRTTSSPSSRATPVQADNNCW